MNFKTGDKISVNAWDLWSLNWEHAKRFFDSRGNVKTRSKLKAEWYKDFVRCLNMAEEYKKEKKEE